MSVVLLHTFGDSCAADMSAAAWQDAGITRERIEADWLQADALRQPAPKVVPETDAAGAVDGVRNGKWGFHTSQESKPWWQVDLGNALPLDRVVVYNRCDYGPERAARIIVLVSNDGSTFRQMYQHDGVTFLGQPDNKPLVVALKGATARYIRLQLPSDSMFHLDEVEVYAVGANNNAALGKPATQSSTSQWSVPHGSNLAAAAAREYRTAGIIERGMQLAEHLRMLGVGTDGERATLAALTQKLAALPANADNDVRKRLYFDAHWTVRGLTLKNPLFDFDRVLFAKGAPGRYPHISDQYYGWWSRPGGGIFLLRGIKSGKPDLLCLTTGFAEGSFIRPELSFDGRKAIFSYAKYYAHVSNLPNKADKKDVPEDAFYHIYEMNIDGTGCRQVTRGKYDDIDARYLPDGDIVFVSTRKGRAVQCSKANTMATLTNTAMDSYVRCGGDNYRPVPVFTLHRMDAIGSNIWPISAFENFEWAPSVANDGRVLFTRWDYIDRSNANFFSLWSCNQDGSNAQLVYGNFTVRPQMKMEARAIPNSRKIVFTAGAHHSNNGGSLVLLDRRCGTEEAEPLVRLTPEVPFPETEAWPETYYANPYPLSEEYYLVAWSDQKLLRNPVNATGIYFYDAFGNLDLIYRDPALSSSCPVPVRPRSVPSVTPDGNVVKSDRGSAFILQDVYQGLPGISRGTVKRLRIVGVPPKTQPFMNNPNLGVSSEDPGKFVIGTVPVEADGSAHFYCPPGIPVFFQALDEQGMAMQTMRTLTYVWPQQTLSCVGCHESRQMAPMAGGTRPTAFLRQPSKITPGPDGAWPLRFDKLVQPALDRHCVSCHRTDSGKGRPPLSISHPVNPTTTSCPSAATTSAISPRSAAALSPARAWRGKANFSPLSARANSIGICGSRPTASTGSSHGWTCTPSASAISATHRSRSSNNCAKRWHRSSWSSDE